MEYDNDRLIRPSYKIEIFYWALLALFNPVFNSLTYFLRDIKMWPVLLFVNLIVLPLYIVYARVLVPKFLFARKPVLFVVISIDFFILIQFVIWLINSAIGSQLEGIRSMYFTYTVRTTIRELLWTFFNLLLAIAIAYI